MTLGVRMAAIMAGAAQRGSRVLSGASRVGRSSGAMARGMYNTGARVMGTRTGKFGVGAGAVGAFSMHRRDVNKRGSYNPQRPKSSGGATL